MKEAVILYWLFFWIALDLLSRSRWPSTPWQDRRRTLSVLKKTPNNDFLFPFHHHTAREKNHSWEWSPKDDRQWSGDMLVQVAIKIINKRKMEHMNMHEKIRREIQILQCHTQLFPFRHISAISASPDQLFLDLSPLLRFLTHPHVIRLYELLDTPSDIFMVGELRTSQNISELGKSDHSRALHLGHVRSWNMQPMESSLITLFTSSNYRRMKQGSKTSKIFWDSEMRAVCRHDLECMGPWKLRAVLSGSTNLPRCKARRFFQQILSGVEYCHQCMVPLSVPRWFFFCWPPANCCHVEVTHRDLKPENLLLDSNLPGTKWITCAEFQRSLYDSLTGYWRSEACEDRRFWLVQYYACCLSAMWASAFCCKKGVEQKCSPGAMASFWRPLVALQTMHRQRLWLARQRCDVVHLFVRLPVANWVCLKIGYTPNYSHLKTG